MFAWDARGGLPPLGGAFGALALVLLFALSAGAQAIEIPQRPATYDSFVNAGDFESLAKALDSATEVYLPPGRHVVSNPIVIDRDRPLFVHGADRMATTLVGRDPGKPLFVVHRAPAVGFANLRLIANRSPEGLDQSAIVTENTEPVWLELLDAIIEGSRLTIGGPGTVRVQAVSFMPLGRVTASVLVDHPGAEVTLVGGNISNNRLPIRVEARRAAHVWQKRGRIRIFGTGLQATAGPSDILIESRSEAGPHAIVGTRSEGANGSNKGLYPCRLLRVPSTFLAVDVILASNSIVCGPLGRSDGAFADYGGRGTLWLIGNNALPGAGALVVGNTVGSRIVAVGNLIQHGKMPVPAGTRDAQLGANLFQPSRLTPKPAIRFLSGQSKIPRGIELPPRIEVPAPLTRPRLTAALPGMLDVRSFGALGDGVRDETKSLQRALDAACGEKPKLLFLPAGTYRTTDVLRFNHERSECREHVIGGWIAGAGSDRTIIRRDPGGRGGVFATHGLAYATVQGLTFRTRAYDRAPGKGSEDPAFALENRRGIGRATQAISFHDVVFDGGVNALAIGVESKQQCSENLLVDASFANAHQGLAVGAYNALGNLVYRGRFDGNDIAMGHPEVGLTGGTWMVLGARIRGTRDRDLNLRSSAVGAWYLGGIDSDTPRLCAVGAKGAAFPVVFESSRIVPRASTPASRIISFGAAGGFVFLHSDVSRLTPSKMGSRMASSFLVGLDSTLPDLSSVEIRRNAIATRDRPAQTPAATDE